MNSCQKANAGPARRPRGFTLVELLTVIFIVGIVAGFSLPALARILDSSKVSAGVNTLVTGVATARLISTSQQPPRSSSTGGGYSGTALIVTPAVVGELRVATNDLFAENLSGDRLEDQTPVSLNGYRDVESFDFIAQPAGTRLVGINRVGGNLDFIEAPFAVRFDENGQLAVGSNPFDGNNAPTAALMVHYNSNNDRFYDTVPSNSRPSDYDDPTSSAGFTTFNPVFNADEEKNSIGPFERFEAVAGVRVLRINDDAANPADDYADVFFSRVTGLPTITRRPGGQN